MSRFLCARGVGAAWIQTGFRQRLGEQRLQEIFDMLVEGRKISDIAREGRTPGREELYFGNASSVSEWLTGSSQRP